MGRNSNRGANGIASRLCENHLAFFNRSTSGQILIVIRRQCHQLARYIARTFHFVIETWRFWEFSHSLPPYDTMQTEKEAVPFGTASSDRQKSPIAALLTKVRSINVPHVRLNHELSLMPCS